MNICPNDRYQEMKHTQTLRSFSETVYSKFVILTLKSAFKERNGSRGPFAPLFPPVVVAVDENKSCFHGVSASFNACFFSVGSVWVAF